MVADGGHHAVVFVKKPVTQGHGQAQAVVGGGAAAHGEHEVAGPAVEGVGQQLALAQRGGAGGVALGWSQQLQAGGAGYFDDGGGGVGQPEVGGLDGPEQRVVGGSRDKLAAERNGQGIQGTFAAIGQGQELAAGRRKGAQQPAPQVLAHQWGRQGVFERIGRNQYSHSQYGMLRLMPRMRTKKANR